MTSERGSDVREGSDVVVTSERGSNVVVNGVMNVVVKVYKQDGLRI